MTFAYVSLERNLASTATVRLLGCEEREGRGKQPLRRRLLLALPRGDVETNAPFRAKQHSDRGQNSMGASHTYCAGAVSEAQRLGCESHVTDDEVP
jgi:hypothetical protein